LSGEENGEELNLDCGSFGAREKPGGAEVGERIVALVEGCLGNDEAAGRDGFRHCTKVGSVSRSRVGEMARFYLKMENTVGTKGTW
jgi:hypothetical protein